MRRPLFLCATTLFLLLLSASRPHAAAGDIVLYAADASNVRGNWSLAADSSAAGGQRMSSADLGWSSTDSALVAPADSFDFTFAAAANTRYHVWLRLKASGNSKFNDSAFVQFSDAVDGNGSAIYRIGTTNGLFVNLQSCNGCALSGWGWLDGAYWLSQTTRVAFASSGTHTLRVQTREDGVSIDQIVLSSAAYLNTARDPKRTTPRSSRRTRRVADREGRADPGCRRSSARRSRCPAPSTPRTSTTAARALRITTRRRGTKAAPTDRRTSISKTARTAASTSAGFPPANG